MHIELLSWDLGYRDWSGSAITVFVKTWTLLLDAVKEKTVSLQCCWWTVFLRTGLKTLRKKTLGVLYASFYHCDNLNFQFQCKDQFQCKIINILAEQGFSYWQSTVQLGNEFSSLKNLSRFYCFSGKLCWALECGRSARVIINTHFQLCTVLLWWAYNMEHGVFITVEHNPESLLIPIQTGILL